MISSDDFFELERPLWRKKGMSFFQSESAPFGSDDFFELELSAVQKACLSCGVRVCVSISHQHMVFPWTPKTKSSTKKWDNMIRRV